MRIERSHFSRTKVRNWFMQNYGPIYLSLLGSLICVNMYSYLLFKGFKYTVFNISQFLYIILQCMRLEGSCIQLKGRDRSSVPYQIWTILEGHHKFLNLWGTPMENLKIGRGYFHWTHMGGESASYSRVWAYINFSTNKKCHICTHYIQYRTTRTHLIFYQVEIAQVGFCPKRNCFY